MWLIDNTGTCWRILSSRNVHRKKNVQKAPDCVCASEWVRERHLSQGLYYVNHLDRHQTHSRSLVHTLQHEHEGASHINRTSHSERYKEEGTDGERKRAKQIIHSKGRQERGEKNDGKGEQRLKLSEGENRRGWGHIDMKGSIHGIKCMRIDLLTLMTGGETGTGNKQKGGESGNDN